jgi:effector-binding domain-containing protein
VELRMAGPLIKFTTAPKTVVASLERKGSHSGVGESMKELKAWIDSKGIEQVGYPICLYFDSPSETVESELKREVCIPVAKAYKGEGKFQIKELAEIEAAETRHQGPPEQFAMTYGPFLEGLLKGGCRLLGPAREYYVTVSDVKGPGAGFLIRQPIAKR